MSLITRCPACQTMFKVVPDQLRISEGWVRCGQCNEVFDATIHMVENPATAPLMETSASEDLPPPSPAVVAAPEPEMEAAEPPVAPVPPAPAPAGSDFARIASTITTEFLHQDSAKVEPVLDDYRLADMDAPLRAVAPPAAPETDSRSSTRSHGDAADASFLRGQRAPSRWHAPRMRGALIALSLLLSVTFCAQILVHERDRVAAQAPGLRGLLDALCGVVGCQIAPMRQIDAIVIDSSAFNKIRGDVYRLDFALKNSASNALAAPAIELTLTDLQDRPVMRRVFQPSEFGLTSPVLQSQSETRGALAVTLKTSTGGERIAGYRILAFYP